MQAVVLQFVLCTAPLPHCDEFPGFVVALLCSGSPLQSTAFTVWRISGRWSTFAWRTSSYCKRAPVLPMAAYGLSGLPQMTTLNHKGYGQKILHVTAIWLPLAAKWLPMAIQTGARPQGAHQQGWLLLDQLYEHGQRQPGPFFLGGGLDSLTSYWQGHLPQTNALDAMP